MPPIKTSEIRLDPKTKRYLCPECGARYPGKKAVGEHRENRHGIPSDWIPKVGRPKGSTKAKKLGAILTTEIPARNGLFHCPECEQGFPFRKTLGVHRAVKHGVRGTSPAARIAQRNAAEAAAKRSEDVSTAGVVLTSAVPKIKGKYHCPECSVAYSDRGHLGYHRRKEHGVKGEFSAIRAQRKAARQKLLTEGAPTNGHALQPVTAQAPAEYIPPHRQARQKLQWTDESIAGYVFAHVQGLIENACQGRQGSEHQVAQRLSEFLHLEVSGQQERRRHLGVLRSMS